MLSPEAPVPPTNSRRRNAFRCVATAVVCLGLSACGNGGFQPVYGLNSATGERTADKLRTVEFAPIPGRVGQRIRNELVFDRNSAGSISTIASRLDVTITESVLTTLVNTRGDSSGQVYQLEARYKLIDLTSKKPVFEGRSLGRAAFDRFETGYANIRARDDAENRVARSVADDIRLRLAAHFASSPR
jgi:LPS-assembly lipoprotein